MPVNNFEKQVQQKMDELQLRPSAEVWQEVEKRIRREKKRRGMILFILLGALLLGGTGWWLTMNDKKQPVNKSITEAKKDTDKINTAEKKENETGVATTEKNENTPEDKKEIIKNNTTENSITTEAGADKKAPVTVSPNNYKEETFGVTSVPGKIKKQKPAAEETTGTITVDVNQSLVGKKEKSNEAPLVVNDIVPTINVKDTNKDSVVKKEVAGKNIIINNEVASDTTMVKDVVATTTAANNNPYPIVSDSSATKQTETVAKKDNSKAKKNKWELGVTAVIGISSKAKDISVLGMNKSMADAYSGGTSNPQNQPQSRPVPYLLPADPGRGNFWQVGAYAKRKFSAKTGLSAGLNFSSYSTIQETGIFADGGLALNNSIPGGSYYTSGTTGTLHTNHYYYLQSPLAFHWQLNKGSRLPITWQNGFSTGLFLGSDALVYDSRSNVFYKNNKSFNKIQFSYQSGLNVKLFNRSRHPLTAGVLFNYHLSKLQKTNIYGGNHLSSFGFQLGWLLKK